MIAAGIATGTDRHDNVAGALGLIADQVMIPDLPVLVKPNFVSTRNQLCATHVEAARAVLEFLWDRGVRHATLAEGPAIGTADEGFDNYGYRALADDFDVTFLDLNADESVGVPAFDNDLNPQTLRMSKTMTESWVVSVCPMKTHNNVIVTLGLKNILVGTLSGRDQKRLIHKGSKAINLTLTKMAQQVSPDLTVIDGTVGMQGEGPVSGDPIESRVAVAAADPIVADVVGLQVMGFELSQVGYLRYCMELRNLSLDDIEVRGVPIDECRIAFRPHSDLRDQLTWPLDGDWRPVFDRIG